MKNWPQKLASKTGLKNWPQKLALKTGLKNWTGSGPGESARAHRIERKMPESQSRLDPNPGFG